MQHYFVRWKALLPLIVLLNNFHGNSQDQRAARYAITNRFINKIMILQRTQMLQRKRMNTIGRSSTCRTFPLWLERQSSSLLSFLSVSISYLHICIVYKSWRNWFYIIFTLTFFILLHFSCLNDCVRWQLCSSL
jgi:hypothetical protein